MLRRGLSSSKQWLSRHVKDKYVRSATEQDLRSRGAFKLLQLNEKHRFLKPSSCVVDLGAAPGGWSVAMTRQGLARRVVAVDLLTMDPIDGVEFIQGDFTDPGVQSKVIDAAAGHIDVICSDMLANTTGHRETDHFRSMELLEAIFLFARGLSQGLGQGQPTSSKRATVLAKYYRGADEAAFISELREEGYVVRTLKPDASRKESREMFLLASPV